MCYLTSGATRIARAEMALRVITITLAGFALALTGRSAPPALIALGAGYVAAAGLLRLFQARPRPAWLSYLFAVIDVGCVTGITALASNANLPIWVLYLPALATSAMSGPLVAAVTIGLSLGSYLSLTWLSSGFIGPDHAWSAATLLAAAFAMVVLSGRSAAEQREKRAWQEIAAAARGLSTGGDPEQIAKDIVEQARRLVRAKAAWLWWCESDGSPRPMAQSGGVSEQTLASGPLAPMLLWKLDRATAQPIEFDEPLANLVGEAIALPDQGERLAILAVAWDAYRADHSARRERLRVFARWAAEALAQAHGRSITAEALRQENILRRAVQEMTAAVDRQSILDVAVDAARSMVNAGIVIGETAQAEGGLAVTIDEASAFVAPDMSPERDKVALASLAVIADIARVSLARCRAYDQVANTVSWLKASVEALPAPLAIRDGIGELLLASKAYHLLGPVVSSNGDIAVNRVREKELVIGDPPRVFVTQTAAAAGGYQVSLYREITKEREALRSKDELIAMVGHELRGPLTSIQGYSQIMAQQIGIVQRQVVQLNRLIGDFMDASRMADGHMPLTSQDVDLAELARTAAERFRGSNEHRLLTLDLAEVPPIQGDPDRLGQVFDNLLGNAAKYSSPDDEIVLSVELRDGEVAISVRDQGIGIAPEYLPHLFERFYRVPGSEGRKEKEKGLGLGLSIVRDLVIAHGGRSWAESEGPGLGSTFWFTLPVSACQEAA